MAGGKATRLRTLFSVAVLAASLAGCGFSDVLDKRASAERISDAFALAERAGPTAGGLATSLTIEKTRLPLEGIDTPFTTPSLSLAAFFDVRAGQSSIAFQQGLQLVPVQAFDESVFYQYSVDAPASRPWTGFDVGRLYDDRDERKGEAFGSNLLNPAYLFQLLPGVLTGSIEERGRDRIDGVAVRHYTANFDASKALDDVSNQRREAVVTALRLMSVNGESLKGEVWIDGKGLPRKVLFRLRERFSRRDIISLNLAASLRPGSGAVKVRIPSRDEATRTTDLGAISRGLQGLVQQFANPGQLRGGGPRG